MPRGDKSDYTDKQKRKAEHIEESYEERGVSDKEAERRAWATVNKESGGGNKSGSGRGKKDTHVSSEKGGRAGVPHPPRARKRNAPPPPRRPPPRASAMNTTATTRACPARPCSGFATRTCRNKDRKRVTRD